MGACKSKVEEEKLKQRIEEKKWIQRMEEEAARARLDNNKSLEKPLMPIEEHYKWALERALPCDDPFCASSFVSDMEKHPEAKNKIDALLIFSMRGDKLRQYLKKDLYFKSNQQILNKAKNNGKVKAKLYISDRIKDKNIFEIIEYALDAPLPLDAPSSSNNFYIDAFVMFLDNRKIDIQSVVNQELLFPIETLENKIMKDFGNDNPIPLSQILVPYIYGMPYSMIFHVIRRELKEYDFVIACESFFDGIYRGEKILKCGKFPTETLSNI